MIMIPAFMQRQLLEQGGVGGVHSPPEPLYSPAPSSLAASGVKSSHMTIQKKPARMKGRPAAVIAEESSRGMPARDREELNEFLKKHSLHAANIKIDLPPKLPRWGSAELFEGDCIFSSLTHPPTF